MRTSDPIVAAPTGDGATGSPVTATRLLRRPTGFELAVEAQDPPGRCKQVTLLGCAMLSVGGRRRQRIAAARQELVLVRRPMSLERQCVGVERPVIGQGWPRRTRVCRGAVELRICDVALVRHCDPRCRARRSMIGASGCLEANRTHADVTRLRRHVSPLMGLSALITGVPSLRSGRVEPGCAGTWCSDAPRLRTASAHCEGFRPAERLIRLR